MGDWKESNRHCKETGGNLVSIESETEWELLKTQIQSMTTGEYLIGLKKDNRSEEWRWISDKSKVNTTIGNFPWARGQPSGDGNCVVMYKNLGGKDAGRFNDLKCTYSKPYICERPADSTIQEGKFHK